MGTVVSEIYKPSGLSNTLAALMCYSLRKFQPVVPMSNY